MKKPQTLIYGLEDRPPPLIAALNGLQHCAVVSINLVITVFVARAAGAPVQVVTDLLAVALLVLSIGTLLQAVRIGPLGSGFMCPATFSATYLSPSLLAAQVGGLPLAYGMTVFAGVLEAVVAPFLNRLRAIFPTEVSGLVIFMVGVSSGLAGLRTVLGPNAAPVTGVEWLVGGLTLGSMAALNVWGGRITRMTCALIGLVLGYVAAGAAGLFDAQTLAAMADAPLFGIPHLPHAGWSIDIAMVLPFIIASFAAAMKAAGTITMCQRMNDADWVRPDMDSIRRGVLADGLSTIVSGALGGFGTNTSTPAVGLAAATGVTSRIVAFVVAAIFFATAFLPKIAAFVAGMPRPVIVAALLFAMTFIITNGLQTMTSRLLDIRRTLVLGLSIVAGVAVEAFPIIAQSAPRAAAPILGSSLVLSAVIALALNLLFRLGVRKTVSLTVQSDALDHQRLEEFFRKQGAMWGARPDVIDRAVFGVIQLVDAVAENCWQRGAMTVTASFDEFNLDVRLSYQGSPLAFPDRRPSDHEIQESEDGVRLLAGFMLRRNADRVRSEVKGDLSTVHFHFDH